MKKNTIQIRYRVNEYAPETFGCSVNGKRFMIEDPSYYGRLVISGKGKEARDEIKREVRKRRKQRRRVTFGFYGKGNNRFFYTRELGAYDDDLDDKLRIYKLWKQFCESKNCDLATTIITEGSVTPNGKGKVTQRESSDIVDLSRPIKLRYPYEEVIV